MTETDRTSGRGSDILPHARAISKKLLASANNLDEEQDEEQHVCDDIETQLEAIQDASNPEELSQAVQFLLRRSSQTHPDLPKIELYSTDDATLLAKVVVDGSRVEWCPTPPDGNLSKVTPRLKLESPKF